MRCRQIPTFTTKENIKLAKISLEGYTPEMLRFHPVLMNSLGSGAEKKTKKLIYNSNWARWPITFVVSA